MALIPSFPKIFTVGDRFTRDLWKGPVEITEKIDGSQFNFGRVQGHVYMRSKGADVVYEDNNKMFDPAKDFVRSIEDKLPEGVIFHGEFVGRPKHNTLVYRRVPKGNFMMFGITAPPEWLASFGEFPYLQRDHFCRLFGCEEVPILFYGEAPEGDKYDWLMEWISEESALGQAQREGVVIKNYTQPVFMAGLSIPFLSAKIVSMEFKEKHKVDWKNYGGKDRLSLIGEAYNAKPRWMKSIQYLRDSNLIEGSPRDIGPILKRIHQDIEEEEKENIKEMLWNVFSKDVKRMAVSGFPEFYKDYLVHGLTDGENAGNSAATTSPDVGHGLAPGGTEPAGNAPVQPEPAINITGTASGLVSGHDGVTDPVPLHNRGGSPADRILAAG
jgi:hypothetical protein